MSNFINSLSIIIVVYKTELDDSESFQSVRQMTVENGPLSVFVYDNSPTAQQLKEYPNLNLTYVHDPKNSGVSKAYNAGAENAKKTKKKWLLLLDQDTTLPANILSHYNEAVTNHPEIHLIVPILKLTDGKIFSPCSYKYKRGFYLNEIQPGIRSLKSLAPVNSGICVRLDTFFVVGGYNENVKLDFSDFQFIERFRKKNSDFVVLNVSCQQDFSDDEVSFMGQATRFRFYCEGARYIEKEGLVDWLQYNMVVFVRALKLTVRYRRISFINTYFNTFLFSKRVNA